jgi:hypothetical protein
MTGIKEEFIMSDQKNEKPAETAEDLEEKIIALEDALMDEYRPCFISA